VRINKLINKIKIW